MANLIFPAYSTIATEAVAYALTSLDNDLDLTARSTTITVAGEESGEDAPVYTVNISAPAGMMCHIKLAFDTPGSGVDPASCTLKYKDQDDAAATTVFTAADDEITLLSLGDKKFLPVGAAGVLGIQGKDAVITT